MENSLSSQFTFLEQDRIQERRRSDDSQGKSAERILITHILATDVIAGLHRLPAGVYVAVDIDGMTTKTSNQPVLIDAKDTVEWGQEIFLPSERSSMLSFKVYASFEIDPQILGSDELLCECKTTVGELFDRNGQLQLPKNSEDSLSCSSLRVIVERRVCDVDHDASATSVSEQSMVIAPETRSGIFQKMTSFFSPPKHSLGSSVDVKAGPRIFALIVAIDKYKSEKHGDLIGCKVDGDRFRKFLTGMLGVPSSRIVLLDDENATRDAILQQFQDHFINNKDIVQGDPMVFFYAGHGTREDAPLGWISEGNKMEAICPHDANTIGHDGKEIYAIHDRTINALIRTLASKKGDNIIFILDCCHSGGATRFAEMSSFRVRSTSASSQPPPLDLDREIWDFKPENSSRAATSATARGSYRALESHILLAACRPTEVASGDASGGLFTSALLKVLGNCTFHDTTYSHMFERLRIRNDSPHPQHPQCMGGYRDRLLFSVTALRHGETIFKVSQREHELYVSAGRIHGIIEGTEFAVTSDTQTITLKAVEVDAFECLLERPHHLNLTFNGTRHGATVSNWNHPTLKVHSSVHHSCAHFTVVPADEPAHIAVRQNGSEWEFERFDPLILAYSTRCITVEAETRPMLEAPSVIANFNSYLYRSDRAGGSFAGEIKVRLNRAGKRGNNVYPFGEDLLNVPSLWFGEMEVKQATITDLDAEYCLTIENYSDIDLFPYLFYFDPSDYAVHGWYMPPGANMHPPLERSKDDGTPSLFAYGYGGFGTDPIEFYLPPGKTTDSGFLKIFLTNAYADMNTVAQCAINEMRLWDPKMRTPKGIWECRTFVLTCKAS